MGSILILPGSIEPPSYESHVRLTQPSQDWPLASFSSAFGVASLYFFAVMTLSFIMKVRMCHAAIDP